ncbi:hypothetical protein AMATHDRAFT_144415 [Amanita thiersii Skay4041]|uniref:Histone-lysine N-methyltransferase, H3 lysine-79 specific n=1 Tax=Amanita thiersii Skay4041 TaxID=703135 RepID=A0A2A9NSQ5_9AGAR|nr:hypothetical protein AMATHDRAFT_144415 [Amanita thiersii Skay4041]
MREFPPPQDSALPSQPSTCLLAKRKCSLDSQECPIPLPVIRHIKKSRSVNAHGEDRLTKRAQKLRSSRTHDRQNTLAPSPEPIYRSSRSRSTSSFPSGCSDVPVQRRRWCVDDDGTPGPTHISSELVVKKLMRTYKGYFKNPNDPKDRSFQPHPHCYPYVELEYPNSGAVERFILLAPKDKDHYNPILDLEQTLYAIVECYLTREQQSLFGSIPADSFSDLPPRPSSPSSTTSISSTDDLTTSETRQSSLEADLLPLASLSGSSRSSKPASMTLLRAVKRAINRQDGPLFLAAMSQINALLHALKYPKLPDDLFAPVPSNALQSAVDGWEHTGLPKKVLMRIIEENYQRIVGPNVVSLKQYEAFSSTVYGELMPSLVHEIVQITGLREESLFLDLGSGVGNVVVQASLQTGCRSFGIELMPAPARIAREMVKQMRIRCRMWGVRMGEVELEEGNMLSSKRMDELIPQADVVLVDNKVFEESLNEALRPKFLDLKEGAIVVSLAPFVSSLNARVTERNVDDISAIFDVTERAYHSGSVSWGINGGSYYIHRVDRAGYAQIRERFESSRARSTRTRK